ncbi:hypothetical protein BD779DRAFT_657208 [Infundibulicybe gibba]|nr:hypothetical protein BD779DRAFT_657208 [Infundibulicybe gibba]
MNLYTKTKPHTDTKRYANMKFRVDLYEKHPGVTCAHLREKLSTSLPWRVMLPLILLWRKAPINDAMPYIPPALSSSTAAGLKTFTKSRGSTSTYTTTEAVAIPNNGDAGGRSRTSVSTHRMRIYSRAQLVQNQILIFSTSKLMGCLVMGTMIIFLF